DPTGCARSASGCSRRPSSCSATSPRSPRTTTSSTWVSSCRSAARPTATRCSSRCARRSGCAPRSATMPELPEVQGLVEFLDGRLSGLAVETLELASFSVLKTFDPPPQALEGAPVDGVHRHGKFLDIDCDGTHLVVHLARAGWLRFSEELPRTPV